MLDNNLYVNTHFRVEAGYHGGDGMTKEQTTAFFAECKDILSRLGFSVKDENGSGACPEGFRGAENLYCHPQDLSGYIIKEKIPEIEAELASAKTFKHCHTDTYEEVLNYTEDEFRAALEDCRPKLEQNILTACVTKRKNLFKVFSFYSLHSLSSDLSVFKGSRLENIERNYIMSLLNQLADERQLQKCKTKSGIGYRTMVKNGVKTNA